MNVSGAVGATIFDGQGLGEILNDDGPVLRIIKSRRLEGHSGTSFFPFIVTLLPASASEVTVDYTTEDGSAVAGSDYTATSGMLTFVAGETTQIIDIPVRGDTTIETNETFAVNLSGAFGATIFTEQGMGTIRDDDAVPLTIALVGLETGKALDGLESERSGIDSAPPWNTQEQDMLLTIGSVAMEQTQQYVQVSVWDGSRDREALGFTICLAPGEKWTAMIRSTGPGQASVQADKPGSCDRTVPAGFTPPLAVGQAVPIAADFGVVELSTPGPAAAAVEESAEVEEVVPAQE